MLTIKPPSRTPAQVRKLAILLLAATFCASAPARCQNGQEWDDARARMLADAPGTIGSAIAQWRSLANGSPGFSQTAAFLLAYPGFPDEERLRRSAEKALATENVAPDRIIAFFDRFPPLTNPARARYALALAQYGRPGAAAMALAAWRGGAMADSDEAAIQARWGSSFTQVDQDARLDALLWDGALTQAQRALAYASPQARAIGIARIALQRMGGAALGDDDSQRAMALATAAANPGIFVPYPASTYPQPGNALSLRPDGAMLADPGYLQDRARALMGQGRSMDAANLLATHPALSHPALDPRKWVALQLALTRYAHDNGNNDIAARVAERTPEGITPGTDISTLALPVRDDATTLFWLGGTTALWQLHQPARAAYLFGNYATAARTPQSRAKGWYWAGRAWSLLPGQEANATNAFASATRYPDQYYGLLALERLGRPLPPLNDPPHLQPTAQQRAAFAARPLTQAVRDAARNADWPATIRFFRAFADQSQGETDDVLAAEDARALGRRDLGVILGQATASNGNAGFRSISFPLIPVPPGANWTWVHAITRQESQFSPNAVSSAGARGLMQLMPGTAAYQARKLGLSYDTPMLTSNPGFNMLLGDAYFHQLLTLYNGSYPLAVAAYNAGPGNVARWLSANGDPRLGGVDWVEWIERIPISETRGYVQHVLENAVVYEALYPDHAAYHGPNPLSYYMGKRTPG